MTIEDFDLRLAGDNLSELLYQFVNYSDDELVNSREDMLELLREAMEALEIQEDY